MVRPAFSFRPLLLVALALPVVSMGCRHLGDAAPAVDAAEGPGPASRTVRLQLLAINDFHGQLEPPEGQGATVRIARGEGPDAQVVAGGLAHLAGWVSHLRAQEPHTLLISAGDLVGASPLSSALFHDEPTIEAMNALGLALHAVGNHEFDDGVAELKRLQEGGCGPEHSCAHGAFAGADFPFLAANVRDASGAPLFAPETILEVEGIPVAFIGVTLQGTPAIVDRRRVAGLTFLNEVEVVNARVAALRARGIEALVVVIHEGAEHDGPINACEDAEGPIMQIAAALDPAVDAVISGHSHAAYNCEVGGLPVTSAQSAGRVLTRMVLELDRETGDVVKARAVNPPVLRDRIDPEMEALVALHRQRVAPLERRIVGELAGPLRAPRHETSESGESSLGNVVADAFLAATRDPDAGGAVVALVNPGGLRADLPAGQVDYGAAFSSSPFGNSLVTLTLTGAQLREALEQQWSEQKQRILGASESLRYAWRPDRPLGRRVVPESITIDGEPLRDEASYRVTVNSFLAAGGDGFVAFTRGTEVSGGPQDLDALVDYLAANSPLTPPPLERVRIEAPAGSPPGPPAVPQPPRPLRADMAPDAAVEGLPPRLIR